MAEKLSDEQILRRFRRVKVMTLAALMQLLGCSGRTVHRRLKQWQCHTSYNCNGRYYALPSAVQFDTYGIWRFKDACFSAYGNLTQTVSAVVNNSEAGLNCNELSAIIGGNAHTFILKFVHAGKLHREKFRGAYVYFAVDRQIRQRQCTARANLAISTLSDADAVVVLVELLNAASLTPSELSERVRARAPTASPQAVTRFFSQHGINAAKKGAAHS